MSPVGSWLLPGFLRGWEWEEFIVTAPHVTSTDRRGAGHRDAEGGASSPRAPSPAGQPQPAGGPSPGAVLRVSWSRSLRLALADVACPVKHGVSQETGISVEKILCPPSMWPQTSFERRSFKSTCYEGDTAHGGRRGVSRATYGLRVCAET